MKTFDRKDIFSWSNAENAKQYIGKEGYFADSLKELQECVSNDNFYTLFSIDLDPKTDVDSIFSITEIDYKYALFIPADKVIKVKEKKWRAFRTYDELKENGLILGLHLPYRRKDNIKQRNVGIITCFQLVDNELKISIGPNTFSLNQLFNEYERYDELEWKPFGVLEE